MALIGDLNVALWNVRRLLTSKQIRDTAKALPPDEFLLIKVLNLVANTRDQDQKEKK